MTSTNHSHTNFWENRGKCWGFKNQGFPTWIVYLHYISCLRYTILVRNPGNTSLKTVFAKHFVFVICVYKLDVCCSYSDCKFKQLELVIWPMFEEHNYNLFPDITWPRIYAREWDETDVPMLKCDWCIFTEVNVQIREQSLSKAKVSAAAV